MVKQKIIVVGGGIMGCMTAMELTRRGHQVTVVERNQIAAQRHHFIIELVQHRMQALHFISEPLAESCSRQQNAKYRRKNYCFKIQSFHAASF